MSNQLYIATVGPESSPDNPYAVTRASMVLSNGTLAAITYDNGLFYLHVANDISKALYVQKASLAATLNAFSTWSATVGPNDNVHLVYRDSTGAIKYVKFTWATTDAYTAGAVETVQAAAGTNISRLDLDVTTGDVVIVGGIEWTSPARARFYIRTTGNAWVNFRNHQISNVAYTGFQCISVCRTPGGVNVPATTCMFAAVYTTPDTTLYSGDVIALGCVVNYSTGALVTTPTLITNLYNFTSRSDNRDYWLFAHTNLNNTHDLVACVGRVAFDCAIGRLNNTTWVVNLTHAPLQRQNVTPRGGTGQPSWNQTAATYVTDAGSVLWVGPSLDGKPRTWTLYFVFDSVANSFSWLPPNYSFTADLWDQDSTAPSVSYVWGGNNRNGNLVLAHTTAWVSSTKRYGGVWNNENYAPVNYYPADTGTVNTDVPILKTAVLAQLNVPYRVRAGIQVAKDSAFTSSVFTYEGTLGSFAAIPLPSTVSSNGGSVSQAIFSLDTSAQPLSQTTWYMRSYTYGPFGKQSPLSPVTSFIVSHPPTAKPIGPGNNIHSVYGTGSIQVSWEFSSTSPGSTQTAYRVVVETTDPTNIVTVVDTGKVVSTLSVATVTIPATYKAVQLRWKVQVWDEDGVVGPFSLYSVFYVVDPATITVTSPTSGQVLNTPVPVITWTFTPPATEPTLTQGKYRVQIKQGTSTVYDSGWTGGADTSFQVPSGELSNSSSYAITLSVEDSVGVQVSTVVPVTTSWTPPAAPTFSIDSSNYDALGYVLISFSNLSKDATWMAWRVYRRLTGDSTWTLIQEYSVDQSSFAFQDFLLGSNVPYDYSVVQVANRFGSPIESVYNVQHVTAVAENYWLIDSDPNGSKFRLNNVTSDNYTDEYDNSVMQLINRGRHVDYGTHWGLNGNLVAKLYDDYSGMTARQKKQALDSLKKKGGVVYLRTPFGDVYEVALDNLQYGRIAGVGVREFLEVTIPYLEVAL